MALTLEIIPELEAALREIAQREGLDVDTFAVRLLEEQVRQRRLHPPTLPRDEAELLQQIGQGLPGETWERYRELVARRQAETLTPQEHQELIALSDEIEEWNAQRLGLLIRLAQLRKVALRDLMDELGLTAPPYA
jgi:hypothetical protein